MADRQAALARTQRRLWFVLVLGLALRLGLFAVAAGEPQRFLMPDSGGYLDLARHLPQTLFSLHGEAPDIGFSLSRTPLYPLFLSTVLQLGGDVRAAILVQALLCTLTVWLVWSLGNRLFGPGPAFWAAALMAVDPASVVYANLLLTEALFALALIFSGWILVRAVERASAPGAAGHGAVLGLATLLRPASLYLPLLLAPLAACWPRRRGLWWQGGLALVLGFVVVVGAWVWRNHAVSGRALVTTMESSNLNYRAIWALAEQEGLSFDQAQARIEAMDLPRAQGRHVMPTFNNLSSGASIRIMLENPRGLAKSSLEGLCRFLFGPGRAGLAQLTGQSESHWSIRGATAGGVALLVLVYAACLWGGWRLAVSGQGRSLALLLCFIGYFALVSAAPESYARFRVPVMPCFCLLAGVGLDALQTRLSRSRGQAS